jgi:stage II sporulation protein D
MAVRGTSNVAQTFSVIRADRTLMRWCALLVAATFTACAGRGTLVPETGRRGVRVNGSVRLRLSDASTLRQAQGRPEHGRGTTALRPGGVIVLPLERYVEGVVAGELGPRVADQAALGVQAIVARTYAVANHGRHRADGFDLCDATHCQVYRRTDAWSAAAWRAVVSATAATAGRILVDRGGPIQALFHADCGGATSDAVRVWGGAAQPYLRGRSDDIGPADPHASPWRFAVGRERLRVALNGDPKMAVGARLRRIHILERDGAGRALSVLLDGERSPVVRGEELRLRMVQQFGVRSVASTRFETRVEAGNIIFEGRGRGHGVGLCQVGALARARAGASVEAVLQHYFPGTRLAR